MKPVIISYRKQSGTRQLIQSTTSQCTADIQVLSLHGNWGFQLHSRMGEAALGLGSSGSSASSISYRKPAPAPASSPAERDTHRDTDRRDTPKRLSRLAAIKARLTRLAQNKALASLSASRPASRQASYASIGNRTRLNP